MFPLNSAVFNRIIKLITDASILPDKPYFAYGEFISFEWPKETEPKKRPPYDYRQTPPQNAKLLTAHQRHPCRTHSSHHPDASFQ